MGLTLEQRRIERPGGVDQVIAPRDWTAARIEAWLDWADTLPADYPAMELPEALRPGSELDSALGSGPDRYARRAAAWGLALKLFDTESALGFREALLASLLAGEAAPARALASGARVNPLTGPDSAAATGQVADLGDIEFAATIDAHLSTARAAQAARSGAEAIARALQAVISAVVRCEGEASACADPLRNAALGRAARAAQQAGAADALILNAIALARAGETVWNDDPASSPARGGGRVRIPGGLADALILNAIALALAAGDGGDHGLQGAGDGLGPGPGGLGGAGGGQMRLDRGGELDVPEVGDLAGGSGGVGPDQGIDAGARSQAARRRGFAGQEAGQQRLAEAQRALGVEQLQGQPPGGGPACVAVGA